MDVLSAEYITSQLSGPVGGIFGLGLGIGFIIGYLFATKTVMRIALDQIRKLEGRIVALESKNENLTKDLLNEARSSH